MSSETDTGDIADNISTSQDKIKSKKTKNRGNSKKAGVVLSPQEQSFINAYTDIQSETYSNGTKSYMQAYQNDNYMSSAVSANGLLKKPKIRTYIQEVFAEIGIDERSLSKNLKSILENTDIRTHRTVTTDKDGNETVTVTERPPLHSDTLKAVEQASKLLGLTDIARLHAQDAMADLRELKKEIMAGMRVQQTCHQTAEDATEQTQIEQAIENTEQAEEAQPDE